MTKQLFNVNSDENRPFGRVLLCNDDGIDAVGLKVLRAIAHSLSDDVWVVAPTQNHSGASRSITLRRDVEIKEVANQEFSVSGTPADCIIFALNKILDKKPDLVLSGVNHGMNVGDDVLYSGTVAAAMEATLAGIPAIALSQQGGRENRDEYQVVDAHGATLIQHLWNNGWPERFIPNVNFPKGAPETIKGMMVASTDQHKFGDIIEDGAKAGYFRLGPLISKPDASPGSDRAVIRDGWIAMTPLGMDLTAYQHISEFEPLTF
ncbi:MAG: 5'/3'-nucleotidase SurE [Candidatus Puniceispirillum sp.]|jgi:5'-nucleotidase|uniref:5'/3'-nucleotidase SurE n=1 Tax=Candidatus Puniceispirillum sp. TaxID=2026719 RepID=UPI001ED08429|nr:5'/3'-nucleotidase SurE [Candidatus Puniceispirillum sp.]MBT6416233.1 5'/3'-nucleotidase SurE [Candidatus Puniceispirillum sp.]